MRRSFERQQQRFLHVAIDRAGRTRSSSAMRAPA
jgi:hypothetical protein